MSTVIKNNNYIVEITGMTHEGQGVGRIEGFTVFVDGAIQGETAEVKVIKVTKSYAVGKLIKIINPADGRTSPFCPIYARCGGCNLQHISYEAQLKFKTQTVKDSIERLGKLQDVKIHDTIGMTEPMRYRNKAQFPVGLNQGTPVSGFYARRSHEIIEGESCGIQDELSDSIRLLVMNFVKEKAISIYDEKSSKGLLRHVMTRVGFKTGQVMVVLVVNGTSFPHAEELVKALIKEVPAIKSIVLNINTKNTNVILGDKNKVLYGDAAIEDTIGKFRFLISPMSFYQVNPVQTEVLYSKALEYAGLTGNETVFDLYCGIGTISLFLSQKAGKVIGVEVVEDAVKDAIRNAELNGVKNVEFISGEAEKVIPELYENGVKADVVVVDPPRKGCDEDLLETLIRMQPQRIVYVSCNPATLARDLKYLSQNGFSVGEIQPVDMFPHTGHVECVVRIQRVN